MPIKVRHPSAEELQRLDVGSWPVWTCGVSTFSWHYDEPETCYLLEGQVAVTGEGVNVAFGKGALVTFPRGLSCVWTVSQPVRKHYRFG